ncbi:MAG: cobalt transporter CbiM [Desulfovibrionaceae bacterium]|nr:cobalt transporter CbiM [Desulfovibrionaceae bacterium]
MHISEGILSAPVLFGGAALSIGGLTVALRRLEPQHIPQTALLCAVFFLASFLRVPLGPGSAHLVLCGLMGALLGWGAFIGIFAALLLQGLLFQFGGLTTLGVNTFNMAAPAVFLSALLGRYLSSPNALAANLAAFCIGCIGLLAAALLTAVSLWISGEHFLPVAQALFIAHIPVAVVEGLVTVGCVQFLRKVRPDALPCANQGSEK